MGQIQLVGPQGGPAQMEPAWPAAPCLECLRQTEGQRRQDVSPREVGLFIHREYSKRAFVGAPPIRAPTIKWLGVQHLPCGSSLRKCSVGFWKFALQSRFISFSSRLLMVFGLALRVRRIGLRSLQFCGRSQSARTDEINVIWLLNAVEKLAACPRSGRPLWRAGSGRRCRRNRTVTVPRIRICQWQKNLPGRACLRSGFGLRSCYAGLETTDHMFHVKHGVSAKASAGGARSPSSCSVRTSNPA